MGFIKSTDHRPTDPPTTDQQTTDHLLIDPPTNRPPIHRPTDPIFTDPTDKILFQRLNKWKIFNLQKTNTAGKTSVHYLFDEQISL